MRGQPTDILSLHLPEAVSLIEAGLADAPVIYGGIDRYRDYLAVWLPFIPHQRSVADTEAFLSAVLAVPPRERNTVFKIEKDGAFCGLIGLVHTDTANLRTEIGYWLLPPYQGQGIVTRCVRRVCRWAVEHRGMNRIQIRCAVGNTPSNAVPLRLGFRFEGTERDGNCSLRDDIPIPMCIVFCGTRSCCGTPLPEIRR